MLRKLCLLTFALLSCQAFAGPVHPTLMLGADGGGDAISNLAYTTSDAAQINVGTDLFAAVGVDVTTSPTFPSAFDFRFTIGLKYASSNEADSNDNSKSYSVNWLRENVELVSFYRNAAHRFRVGIGVNYEFASWINGSLANGATNSFKPTTGMIFEFDYLPENIEHIGIGLRINNATYQSANTRESFSGDGVGLILFTH